MFFSKYPKIAFLLINVVVAAVILVIAGYLTLRHLDSYTLHGYSITVPSFHHLNRKEAEELARKNNLKVVIVDSIYDEKAVPGSVQEQYPSSGAKVKALRTIQLTVCAYNPEQVLFPQLNNSSYRQTLQTLEAKGFRIGKIEYAPSEFKNLVLQLRHEGREIEAGSLLRKGSRIDIVLGDGGNAVNYVPLPQLRGLKTREAIKRLQENHLNIGQIIPDKSLNKEKDFHSAVIFAQHPAYLPHTNVPAGSSVDLEITRDKKRIAALDSLIVTE